MSNLVFPQAGIITSLDFSRGKAKVFIPLYKIETSWIPVATNLLYEEMVNATKLVSSQLERAPHTVYADEDKTTVVNTACGAKAVADQEVVGAQTIRRLEWHTLRVGDEVVVVFLNGNINDGRIVARF